ncbi:MAG TPA: ferritin-like domain-containing protein [Acidobacteriota bacterium]|nr:ferritin-like domain-containing protein [Acidobacteriota bacterium]
MKPVKDERQAVKTLNEALAWEMRAALMYAHYAAYLVGRDRLDFEDYFSKESEESMGHAKIVRQIIADIGGKAVTTPDPAPIPDARDANKMLAEALKTEEIAEMKYREVLSIFEHQTAWHHDLRHIMMDEEKAQIELRRLMK